MIYTCVMCWQEFESDRAQEELHAEAEEALGMALEDWMVLCPTCLQMFRPQETRCDA